MICRAKGKNIKFNSKARRITLLKTRNLNLLLLLLLLLLLVIIIIIITIIIMIIVIIIIIIMLNRGMILSNVPLICIC